MKIKLKFNSYIDVLAICLFLVLLSFVFPASSQDYSNLETPGKPEIINSTVTSISLSWKNSVKDASGYILERRDLSGGWHRIRVVGKEGDVYPLNEDSFFRISDDYLGEDTVFCYRLIAFNDTAYSVSPESCGKTQDSNRISESKKLPEFLKPRGAASMSDLVQGELSPCADPIIEQSVRNALDRLADLGEEFPQDRYICETDGWGIQGSFEDLIDTLTDLEIDNIGECIAGTLGSAFTCGASAYFVLECVRNYDPDSTCLIEVCDEDTGVCRPTEAPCSFTDCLVAGGATAVCLTALTEFKDTCF